MLLITLPGGATATFEGASNAAGVADVLAFVEAQSGIPSAMLQLRMGCLGVGAPLRVNAKLPPGQYLFEARLAGGLKGGKGGFGAMLRALAKQNTGHKTTDFGACRDLNGRRLRHVNNDIKLQKWAEARERKEEAKRRGIELDSDDEERVTASESGIKGWHLSVPSWIEHVKQRETKTMRRKTASKRRWQDEEEDVEEAGVATRTVHGSVTMVDGVRSSFAIVDGDIYVPFTANAEEPPSDWSTVLKVGDRMDIKVVAKTQGRNKWYGYKAVRISADDHGSVPAFSSSSSLSSTTTTTTTTTTHTTTYRSVSSSSSHPVKKARKETTMLHHKNQQQHPRADAFASKRLPPRASGESYLDQDHANETVAESMAAAVTLGLAQEKTTKKRAEVERNNEQLAMLPVDLEEHTKKKAGMGSGVMRWNADRHKRATTGWMGLLAGELEFAGDGVVRGVSEFASVCALGVSLTCGKWYYEVELRSSGVMQVGWADQLFKGDSDNGDGVGDDEHSWAYDGCRQQKWNGEIPEDYGAAWTTGDVVGCLLDLDEGGGAVSFTLNGQSLSSAFNLGLNLSVSLGAASVSSSWSSNTISQSSRLLASEQQGFYPAAAVEDGEVLALRVTAASLRFGPPDGFRAVADAMAVKPPEPLISISAPARPIASLAEQNLKKGGGNSSLGAPTTKHPVDSTMDIIEDISPEPSVLRNVVDPEELDLSGFSSPEELQLLGLDRLKAAALFLGVKCGGTLQQRAERLFSLKGVPRESIDPKLLSGKRKR